MPPPNNDILIGAVVGSLVLIFVVLIPDHRHHSNRLLEEVRIENVFHFVCMCNI